jgi:drug/metabolite transporter (DMT)-like permease
MHERSGMAGGRSSALGPGTAAALCFGVSNVFGKLAFLAGADVLSLVAFRGVVGVGGLLLWLRLAPPAAAHSPRARAIALGLGVLFAGNVYSVYEAIRLIPVPVAVLAYFVYPLLTGIGAAVAGLERLTWRGAAAALVAFGGLALMVGAQPGALVPAGVAWAFGAACCRTAMLLITRATLAQAEARLTTWYSMLSSTVVLVALAVVLRDWTPPGTVLGWTGFAGASVTTTLAVVALFTSIERIGPFRTALLMNLEPVVTTVLGIALIGDRLGALQGLGGALMIGALVMFQLRR